MKSISPTKLHSPSNQTNDQIKKQYLRTRIQIKNKNYRSCNRTELKSFTTLTKQKQKLEKQLIQSQACLKTYLNMFPQQKKRHNNSLFNFLNNKFGQKASEKCKEEKKNQEGHAELIIKKKNGKEPFGSLSADKIMIYQAIKEPFNQQLRKLEKKFSDFSINKHKNKIVYKKIQNLAKQQQEGLLQNPQQIALHSNQAPKSYFNFQTDSSHPQTKLVNITQLMQKHSKFDRKKYMYYRYRKKSTVKKNSQYHNEQIQKQIPTIQEQIQQLKNNKLNSIQKIKQQKRRKLLYDNRKAIKINTMKTEQETKSTDGKDQGKFEDRIHIKRNGVRSPERQKQKAQKNVFGVVVTSNRSILNIKPKFAEHYLNRRNSQRTSQCQRKQMSKSARQGYRKQHQKNGSKFFQQAIHFKIKQRNNRQFQKQLNERCLKDDPIKGWNSKQHTNEDQIIQNFKQSEEYF